MSVIVSQAETSSSSAVDIELLLTKIREDLDRREEKLEQREAEKQEARQVRPLVRKHRTMIQ